MSLLADDERACCGDSRDGSHDDHRVAGLRGSGRRNVDLLAGLFVDDDQIDFSQIGVLDLIAFTISSPHTWQKIPKVGGYLETLGVELGNLLMELAAVFSSALPIYTAYNIFDTY